MMILCGQSNRIWHYWAGRYPGAVGVLIGPSYMKRVPIDDWMPFALDNDAFKAWRDGTPWNETEWRKMIEGVRLTRRQPIWAAVPDVVANREQTIRNWKKYSGVVKGMGWKAAFCVQDGMTPSDVPLEADVVFVGGSDGWKFPNLPMWTKNFPEVHCARVTSEEMIKACRRLGCVSIDGTGWFREPSRQDHVPMLKRFIEEESHCHPLLPLKLDH